MSELPYGWGVARLPDVCELNPGKPEASRITLDTQVTFVPMAAVDAGLGRITNPTVRPYAEVSKGFTAFQENDVILAKITPCMENGKAAIARGLSNGMGFGSTEFHVFRNNNAILPEYLFYFIRQDSFRKSAEANMTGSVGQKRVPVDFLKETILPLPPLNEQRRIVAKLETLLSRVDAAQARLATIPHIIKRFRQSVLAAACSGRLTADWRDQDSHSDNSSDITQRVFEFRRATWERIQLQKMRSNGKSPKNQRWRVKYPEPDVARTEDLPELPTQWAWLKLGILGRDPLNTVQTGPFGALLHNSEFTKTGVPVVAVGNLTGMGFSHDGLYFITKVKAEQLARFDVWAGDVLFARSGATTGKVCVAPPEVQDWRMTGHILRARLNTDVVFPEFMVYALHGSPTVKEQVTGNLRGATRPGFNTSLLEVIDIPVAPLAEQQEIVRRVGALFKTADALEARYRKAKAHVDKLTQSILAKAFRGELVPQDPNDEPASVLLERIRKTDKEKVSRKIAGPKHRRASAS